MKTTNQRHFSLPLIIRGRILLFPVVLFFSSFLIFSVVRFFIPSRLTMWISGLGVPNIHGTDGIGFFCWETYRAPLRSYRLLVIISSVVRILLGNFFFFTSDSWFDSTQSYGSGTEFLNESSGSMIWTQNDWGWSIPSLTELHRTTGRVCDNVATGHSHAIHNSCSDAFLVASSCRARTPCFVDNDTGLGRSMDAQTIRLRAAIAPRNRCSFLLFASFFVSCPLHR